MLGRYIWVCVLQSYKGRGDSCLYITKIILSGGTIPFQFQIFVANFVPMCSYYNRKAFEAFFKKTNQTIGPSNEQQFFKASGTEV